jgi:hypothetical protein
MPLWVPFSPDVNPSANLVEHRVLNELRLLVGPFVACQQTLAVNDSVDMTMPFYFTSAKDVGE